MEKLVPADSDIKALNDRSINEITSLPGLPTYLKVHLGDMHTPLYLNLKYHYDNPRDSVVAQSFVYISGTSTRPSEASCQYKYKNVSNEISLMIGGADPVRRESGQQTRHLSLRDFVPLFHD